MNATHCMCTLCQEEATCTHGSVRRNTDVAHCEATRNMADLGRCHLSLCNCAAGPTSGSRQGCCRWSSASEPNRRCFNAVWHFPVVRYVVQLIELSTVQAFRDLITLFFQNLLTTAFASTGGICETSLSTSCQKLSHVQPLPDRRKRWKRVI